MVWACREAVAPFRRLIINKWCTVCYEITEQPSSRFTVTEFIFPGKYRSLRSIHTLKHLCMKQKFPLRWIKIQWRSQKSFIIKVRTHYRFGLLEPEDENVHFILINQFSSRLAFFRTIHFALMKKLLSLIDIS